MDSAERAADALQEKNFRRKLSHNTGHGTGADCARKEFCHAEEFYNKRRYRKRRTPKRQGWATGQRQSRDAGAADCDAWRSAGTEGCMRWLAPSRSSRKRNRRRRSRINARSAAVKTRSRRGAYCSQCRAVGGCGGGQHGPAGQALFAVGGCTLMHDEGKCLSACIRTLFGGVTSPLLARRSCTSSTMTLTHACARPRASLREGVEDVECRAL